MAREIERRCAWLAVAALLAGACGDDGGGGGGAATDGGAGSAGSGATGGSSGLGGASTGGSSGLGGASSGGSAGSNLDGGAGAPMDGSAGSSGSSGSAGSSGSGGGSGTDGGGDGGTLDCTAYLGVTQSAACASYANAYCTLISTCSPAGLSLFSSSVAHCKQRIEIQCALELEAPQGGMVPAAFAAGADALSQLTCADFYASGFESIGTPGPNCGGPGALATGKQCYANSQCASGECLEGDPCGTCVGTGSSCDSSSDCLDDQFCNALDKCEPKKSAGQPCAEHDECAAKAHCAGTCQPDETSGAACNEDEECEPPLICGANKQCKLPARAAQGASCTPGETLSCNTDLMLSCDATTQKCVLDPFPGPGEQCGLFNQGGVQVFEPFCAGDSTCVFASGTFTGTCVANAADGAACNETTGPYCTFNSHCVNGSCTVANATLCPPN